MKNRLVRVGGKDSLQFYYIVGLEDLTNVNINSIRLFNEMHGHSSISHRVDTCKTFMAIAADKSATEKAVNGYKIYVIISS